MRGEYPNCLGWEFLEYNHGSSRVLQKYLYRHINIRDNYRSVQPELETCLACIWGQTNHSNRQRNSTPNWNWRTTEKAGPALGHFNSTFLLEVGIPSSQNSRHFNNFLFMFCLFWFCHWTPLPLSNKLEYQIIWSIRFIKQYRGLQDVLMIFQVLRGGC